MFSDQFYEKRLSVRKEYEIVTWNCHLHSFKESVPCIITIETVMCIRHCRKYRIFITIKIAICILAAETVTCICAAETSNCIIATCIILTEKFTNIPVT